MSAEFVTLAVVRELLETQERAFKQIMEFQMNAVKEEMKLLKKDVDELKSSLTFSQKCTLRILWPKQIHVLTNFTTSRINPRTILEGIT